MLVTSIIALILLVLFLVFPGLYLKDIIKILTIVFCIGCFVVGHWVIGIILAIVVWNINTKV